MRGYKMRTSNIERPTSNAEVFPSPEIFRSSTFNVQRSTFAFFFLPFAAAQRKSGKTLTDAAAGAVDLRLRTVLMTAFSFILGVLPLLFSTGAGSESQKVIGITVFSGMVVSTVLSLVAIPMLYYLVARLTGQKDEPLDGTDTGEVKS